MKVLLISGWFPYPADNGAKIRIYNLIKALSIKHKVYLISLLQEDASQQDVMHLSDICEIVSLHKHRQSRPGIIKSISGFISKRPRSFVERFDSSILQSVQKAIESISPDVIVASTLDIVEYVPHHSDLPTILDEHNCEYAVLKRHANRVNGHLRKTRYEIGWRKFARWEADICRRFDSVVMVSEDDKRQLLAVAPDLSHISIVPNGVDTEYFTPSSCEPDCDALIYNGALTYGANLDAVRYYSSQIYPILKSRLPDTILRVTGRTAGVDLSGIKDCAGIELTNYVKDIRVILYTCSVCIVPLREGGGSRLKILEAMAAGVPVVSTSVGAEGIKATDGTHLLLADTPISFVCAIERIMSNPDLRQTLCHNARQLVEQSYSWPHIGNVFTGIVESTAAAK